MANTTFTGPVRSEGGFQVVSKNATTGAYTDIATIASTGIVTDKYVKHVGFATGVTVNSTAGDSPAIGEFTQPANTIITDIKIFCAVAPVIGTGDIGYEVGTSSSGAQIVAAIADEILDGGTTVVVGNVTTTTLVATTQSATTAPVSAQYTSAERTIYCNITNTVNSTTDGSFTFIIEYVQIA
jgi:hypothetical protein|tara:strand:- start:75 stop:623 length:549 start_codon:yes stop_codon:yes gene_type:complete